jgi:hypothetical protein
MSGGGTLPWFETVWSYGVEALGCWIIFSMKIESNQNWTNYEIWGHSWCCWKALGESDLLDFISQFSELRLWKISIFKWILLLGIQTNCKNWVQKEKSVELSMCSDLGQRHRLTLVLLISYGSSARAWHFCCKLLIPEGQYPWRCRELTTICTSNRGPLLKLILIFISKSSCQRALWGCNLTHPPKTQGLFGLKSPQNKCSKLSKILPHNLP